MGCSSGRLPSAPLDPECPDPDPQNPDPESPNPDPNPDLSTLERLAQATGGSEKSWYRCVFPFGVISLVIGLAGSGVTFSFNTLAQTRVLSLVLLVLGLVLLLTAAICWRIHRSRRREEKEAGIFSSEIGPL
ncbi:transmembrane protein 100 [Pseudorasbora parva]|uniref:transmembrane protein 100 n=1 Tax=Pseudorasbora parva TaxID=51549 RepID=UPI00351DB7F1